MSRSRSILITALTAAALIPAGALAVSKGSVPLEAESALRILLEALRGSGSTSPDHVIVLQLRLPRVLAAFFIGGGLSIIGVAMQALVRNPLAEPYILGISGGASAGASLFYLGFLPPVVSVWLSIPIAAFVGALLAITAVYAVARGQDGLSISRLLLAGVATASLMAAVTSFITYLSPDPNQLRVILFWLLGDLSKNTWESLPMVAGAALAGLAILFVLAPRLDAMLLGEESAAGLGVRVERLKRILIVTAALVTGVVVAHSGAIGFVGLIVPHVVRSVVGVGHRFVVVESFFAGGLFLIVADLLARSVLPGQDLPVGIVTALAGVPFFLMLLRRTHYKFS